jgi:hypothetical protein
MKTQSINKTLQDAFRGDSERRLSVPWEHLEAFVFRVGGNHRPMRGFKAKEIENESAT